MTIWSPQQDAALVAVGNWFRAGQEPIFRVFGYAGTGKAQSVHCQVQTPSGPRRLGDMRVGDAIFGLDGKPQRVDGVYPQGVKPSWRVTFRDGASTLCCPDHLWAVRTHCRGSLVVMTTRQMRDSGLRFASGPHKFRVPLCAPVQYEAKELPVPPYTLGALIGDGYLSGSTPCISCPSDKLPILDRVMKELGHGFSCRINYSPSCPQAAISHGGSGSPNSLTRNLKALDLNVNSPLRFIPPIYMLGSIQQRIDLLRGLMDTDGSSAKNRVRFSTSSLQLAADIVTLVQSLGGTAISKKMKRKGEWSVNIKMLDCPFWLPSKADGWSASKKNGPSRCIWSIEDAGDEEQVCIRVSNGDSLYLTDSFIATHNTTLAKHFAEGLSVVYMAFTGKAAMVMKKNGAHGATTIHSTIYDFKQDPRTGQKIFVLKPQEAFEGVDLFIIDECSMVDEELGRDVLSFGIPVLVLGDPAQLPPVSGGGFFTNHQPDVMLTEIHRQAGDSPIIRMATDVREGKSLGYGRYGESQVIRRTDVRTDDVINAEQVIVGTNKSRTQYNARFRQRLGFNMPMPMKGERLICTKNEHGMGLFNGGLWTVIERKPRIEGDINDHCVRLAVTSEDFQMTTPLDVRVREECFDGRGIGQIEWKELRGTQQFDFGYVLTVHKAQGSSWEDVLLFDESGAFSKDSRRWLYTGVTRASERITIVM